MTSALLSKIKLNQTPLQRINDRFLDSKNITLFLKRIDLIHPVISGNKWFKLKYNLEEAHSKGYTTLLSFGGAYSNHIHALAYAGKELNFKTIGIIRGEEHLPLNPTLSSAKENGMMLHYISRGVYRNKYSDDLLKELNQKFGNFYMIPEGGSNELAVKGCSEIMNKTEIHYDFVCTACGTAGTMSGIVRGMRSNANAIGFAVLKNASFLNDNVNNFLQQTSADKHSNWTINLDYHFGGYAKIDSSLMKFIDNFELMNNIPLDPIYTGKMMFGIYQLIAQDFFPSGSTIIALHTGGLQGIAGFKFKMDLFRNKGEL